MDRRLLIVVSTMLLSLSCGGDKHLLSSNPPEYDPKKVYTLPSSPATQSIPQSAKPEPQASLPPPSMDPEAFRQALETADRTRTILRTVESLSATAQIHAVLEALMMGEQAPPDLRPTFRETFEARKAQIHQVFDRQYEQLQQTLDEEYKRLSIPPPLSGSHGSELFSRYRVSAQAMNKAKMPWMHLVDLPRGSTVTLDPDCCGAWHIVTIPDNAFEGGGFSLEIKSAGRYDPDKDHAGEGDAITVSTKVVAGDKATIKVKILKKNRAVVRRCPSASGLVPGDASLYDQMGYSVSTPSMNSSGGIFVHDRAKTKAQTDAEGLVQEITLDITAADLDGETGMVLRQASGRAIKKRDMPVVCFGCDTRVGEAAKRLARMASWSYYNAEQKWRKPEYKVDACVKVHFTPATREVAVSAGGSTKVRAELRTVAGDQATEGRLYELQELNGGKVTPKDVKTSPEALAEMTFTAPGKTWTKSERPGFRVVNSASKAGRAAVADWEIANAPYVLEFQSRIITSNPSAPAESVAAGKVRLTPVPGKEGWYRGSGAVGYQTGPPPNRDPCSTLIIGHGTTRLDVAGISIKVSEQGGAPGHQTGSAEIEMHYVIQPTNETERPFFVLEGKCVPREPEPIPFFYSMYAVSRGGQDINSLKNWTYVGKNGVVAVKKLRSNCDGLCDQEVTVFTLKEETDQASPPK